MSLKFVVAQKRFEFFSSSLRIDLFSIIYIKIDLGYLFSILIKIICFPT